MSVKNISTRIELSFWQIIISLLSQSKTFQKLVRWFYQNIMPKYGTFLHNLNRHRIFHWALIGLGFGFAIGFLIALF